MRKEMQALVKWLIKWTDSGLGYTIYQFKQPHTPSFKPNNVRLCPRVSTKAEDQHNVSQWTDNINPLY